MAAVTLPPTFHNSFWTQDYRTGLEVLFGQLEKGVVENEEIVAFIKSRAAAENAIAVTLTAPAPPSKAFDSNEGASLVLAFKGLKEESLEQGKLHGRVAEDLQTKVAGPFSEWADGYKERLLSSRANLVEGYLRAYERSQQEVATLKGSYVSKTHKADEMEDDVRFAPISQPQGETYTTSPNLGPKDKRLTPRTPSRQMTVSERISARLKEFRLNASTGTPSGSKDSADEKPEVHFDADAEEKGSGTPKVDKGKGRAIDDGPILASPPPLSPPLPPAKLATNPVPPPPGPPIVVAGLLFTAQELSDLLTRAKAELPLRPVRFPLLGEYQEAFTGDEFTTWLRDHVKALEGNLDRAEDTARDIVEKQNLLRRLGELGNEYENSDEAFYQFRPKAFNLDVPKPKEEKGLSPLEKNLSPLAENVAKRTAGLASLVGKVISNNPTGEAPYVRARREAEAADQEYRTAVRKLDRQRLGLEERIEDQLKLLQKWELDRLRAVKTVLQQYHGCLEALSKGVPTSLERSNTLIAAYQPESDLKALIEQYRTGPFRPVPHVYESVAHDESDVVFGIDLRKWADAGFWHGDGAVSAEKKDTVPPVLTAMLAALNEAYAKLPTDAEKRKTWIYEVPLVAVHHLRETLNSVPPMQDIPDDTLSKYDAPVIASAVKLWVLELDPPLCMYEGWDELRKLYPIVGSVKPDEQQSEESHIQELQTALQKLPRIHLLVLDTLIKHLKDLVDGTSGGEETNEMYITKLGLSLGRAILRPKVETKFSVQDRHPTLLFIDLVLKYNEILPPTIAKKKRESERKVPIRKRTRPMDMRMSRSRISAGADLKELHAQQLAQKGLKTRSPPPVPPVPGIFLEDRRTPSAEPQSIASPTVTVTSEPESIPQQLSPVPPSASPVVASPVSAPDYSKIPPPPPLIRTPSPQVPVAVPTETRPSFKEPPPEDDDLPPRPQFREPSPERSDSPPPLPNPHGGETESHDESTTSPSATSSQESPSFPRPQHFAEPPESPPPVRPGFSRPTSPPSGSTSSRSASPSKVSLSRRSSQTPSTGGGQTGSRGPRTVARGPRPGGGSVSSMVSNFNNRSSVVGGPGIARPSSPATAGQGRSPSRPVGTHVKRSSASRASMFERRTMASDAEDEIIQ